MLTVAIVAWVLLCILILSQPFLVPRLARAAAEPESPDRARRRRLLEEKRALYRELHDLELDHDTGKLSAEDYRGQREHLVGSAAQVLQSLEQTPANPAAAPSAAVPAPAPPEPSPQPEAGAQRDCRFCTACGVARDPEDRFCRSCGQALK